MPDGEFPSTQSLFGRDVGDAERLGLRVVQLGDGPGGHAEPAPRRPREGGGVGAVAGAVAVHGEGVEEGVGRPVHAGKYGPTCQLRHRLTRHSVNSRNLPAGRSDGAAGRGLLRK